MSDTDTNSPVQDELAALKVRADLLGISYHPSIGVDKLREKVNGAVTSTPNPDSNSPAPAAATAEAPVVETEGQIRHRRKMESSRLVRIRVSCMNPAKKEWAGEIFTTGNSAVGTFRKYVPFNAEDGWHVPYMIYEMIRDRMCQVFITVPDGRGNKIRKGKLIKEFSVEVLDQLTADEIADLARRQAMANSIG